MTMCGKYTAALMVLHYVSLKLYIYVLKYENYIYNTYINTYIITTLHTIYCT